MATFTGTLSIVINALLDSGLDIGTGRHSISETYSNAFTSGTGANQANEVWADTRTISSSSSDDLDLYGSLTDAFGTTLNFTSIKAIIIKASSSNGDNLSVGGDAGAPISTIFADTSDEILVPPGGMFMITNPQADGFAVTNTTADVLEITNTDSGDSAEYDIIIVGEV